MSDGGSSVVLLLLLQESDKPHGAHGFPPVMKRGSFVRSKENLYFSDLKADLQRIFLSP